MSQSEYYDAGDDDLGEGQGTETQQDDSAPATDETSAPVAAAPSKVPEVESDEDYSRRVQKRIDREVRKRREAEEMFQYQLAQQQARMAELEARLAEREQANSAAELEKQEQEARRRLREAEQQDDLDAKIEAHDKLAEVKARRFQAQAQAPKPAAQSPAAAPQQPASGIPSAQQEWMKRHADWYDGRNEDSLRAKELYEELVQDYNPNSPRLYEELDRLLGKAKPAPEALPGRQLRSGPGAASGNTAASSQRAAPSTQLTAQEREAIRNMGKDPDDAATRQKFIKIREAIRAGANQ